MHVTSNKLSKNLSCPTSKSYANRALILGALKKEKIELKGIPEARDVKEMISALSSLGLNIKKSESSLQIYNSFPECEKDQKIIIDVYLGEGGTTSRFLFPLICLGHCQYRVQLSEDMAKRPIEPLLKVLRSMGASIEKSSDEVYLVKGPIELNQKLEIDCSVTTQFASAFMHLELQSELIVEPVNIAASSKYLDMTRALISLFRTCDEYVIPVDFSSAGYLIGYSIFSSDSTIGNIYHIDKFQADSILISILRDLGVNIGLTEKGLELPFTSTFKKGMKVDGSTCLDLVPTLMFIAANLPFESTIYNIENLRHKECDRLSEMLNILNHFSVNFAYDSSKDSLQIFPSTLEAKSKSYTTLNDHRMVMVLSLFYKITGGGEVHPANSVNKSFPEFFSLFH